MVHRPRLKSGLTLRGGLARSVAALHLYKSFALKDWIVFAEVFGLPIRLGRYDTGAHKEADIATLRTAVANIGTDAAAVIPRTMEMEFIEASRNDGEGLFSVLADWLDRQTSKVILGQTMTTDDGSSRAQAVVHDAVRSDILAADAKALSATINRDLVRPWVDLNYGPQQLYPTATLAIEEQEDLETLSKALPPFIDRGLAVEAAAIRDKFGLQEPAKDAETLEPKAGGGGGFEPASLLRALAKIGDSKGERDVIGQIAADFDDEWREVLGPLVEPIARLAETSSGYSEFKRRLPSVLRNVPSDVIVDTIATMDFMARGVGDATDSIK
jgi:phage gp29-like protein